MSSGIKVREDQVLVICPGSQTTLAQLGVGELTPPARRFPTRMFPSPNKENTYLPRRIYKRKKIKPVLVDEQGKPVGPVPAGDLADGATKDGARSENKGLNNDNVNDNDVDWEWVEENDSEEGAIYPMVGGRLVNMEAFLAFLVYVHSTLTTTYQNTPILLTASPQWTHQDLETITRYVFEHTRTPNLCIIASSITAMYGMKGTHMCVVDIGFQKVDCTVLYDHAIVRLKSIGGGLPSVYDGSGTDIAGGEAFTLSLLQKLREKDEKYDYNMAEQLKKSPICEVLPYAPGAPPDYVVLPSEAGQLGEESGPTGAAAAVAASGTKIDGPAFDPNDPTKHTAKDGGGVVTSGVDDDVDGTSPVAEADGVLDIATIVASGQTKEFLAKKEQEKQEREKERALAKAKKGTKHQEAQDAAALAARIQKLPNARRLVNVFHYETTTEELVMSPYSDPNAPADQNEAEARAVIELDRDAKTAEAKDESNDAEAPAVGLASQPTLKPQLMIATRKVTKTRTEHQIGLERFTFATRPLIDRIATLIFETVQSIPTHMRAVVWENIVFVGNGARLRGLRENIMATLAARHLVSPSSASMFLSELPSQVGTPVGTGAQTPTPHRSQTPLTAGSSFNSPLVPTPAAGQSHQTMMMPPHSQLPSGGVTGGVNPLLIAATTAAHQRQQMQQHQNQHHPQHHHQGLPGTPSAAMPQLGPSAGGHSAHNHSHQTPTKISLLSPPTYLAEWNKHGFEEATFLGSLIGARMAFCQPHGADRETLECIKKMSIARSEYNEYGATHIHRNSLLR